MTEDNESSLEDFDSYQDDDGAEQARKEAAEVAAKNHEAPSDHTTDPDLRRSVPELRSERSEHDRTLRPGTPVRDMWNGSWLITLRKKADTVTEYDRQQPDTKQSLLAYEGSIGTGATESDAVWACFYLNANNTLAGGRSGPYDFPESRICRYAYDSTDGFDGGRVQDVITTQVLEQIAFQALATGEPDQIEAVEGAMKRAFGAEQKDEAFELAEASGGD